MMNMRFSVKEIKRCREKHISAGQAFANASTLKLFCLAL
jgi:hypothetical protein